MDSLGFEGREIEIDPQKSVSGGENPLPTVRVVGLTSVGSDMVGFFRWVESSNGFGHP